jgi:hypothetical protein
MKVITGDGWGRWFQRQTDDERERRLDEQLENSFPASDPLSFSPIPSANLGSHAFKAAWNRTDGEH